MGGARRGCAGAPLQSTDRRVRADSRCGRPTATTIEHGYASIARFFPGARDELAALDEAIVLGALGPYAPGKAHCFEDQYASTGGQLYELMAGHDRFVADLRPLMRPLLAGRGLPPALTCHPYDICTALIAEESGVIVTDPYGRPLDAPLNVEAEVAWAGYANAHIRAQIEPLLQEELRARGWIASRPERRTAELDAFVETLRAHGLFERGAALAVSRAPGRLDVMGGIADYSGSLVLAAPDRGSDVRGRAADRSSRAGDRQPRPAALHDSARGAGAGRRAGRLRHGAADVRGRREHGAPPAPHWVSYVAGVLPRARARARDAADDGRAESSSRRRCPRARA